MKRYEKYKDSGISWIGEIPEHWQVTIIGRVTKLGRGRVISRSEMLENPGKYPVYSSQTENNGIMGYLATYDFEGEYVTWTTDGANAGTVSYRKGKFNCTNVCGTIQPIDWEKIDLRFLPYFLNLGTKFSVRLDINPKLMNGMMAKIPLVLPPKSEQTAIANYLDCKTAQIDELIAKKERLLELYEEEKTAIINQAVTRGINPNVKLKDSRIPWLGKIPAHWEVKKLKYVVLKIGSGVTPKGGANVYILTGIPLLRSQNIHFEGLKLEDVAYISEEIHNRMSNSKVKSGDVLLNITGASIGRCCFVEDDLGEANVNQHVCIIRPNSIETKFLYNILRSDIGQKQIALEQTGSGREGLNFEALKNFLIFYTNIEEQRQIAAYIEKETALIDAKIEKTKKLIELLKEYKTVLINEVVTGKIKVYEEESIKKN